MKNLKRKSSIWICLAMIFCLTGVLFYVQPDIRETQASIKTKITMLPKEQYTLNVGKKATYTSSNSKIASVTSNGKITAKKVGKTTVSIKTSSKQYKVTVAVVGLSKSNASLKINSKLQLKVKNALKSTKWSSTKSKVAKVSKNGLVTGVSEGTAYIKAVTDGKTLKCKVQVKNNNTLEVHFIDVGQADCILLKETAKNTTKNYLIDCGNVDDKDTIIEYLKKQKVKTIDGLFLSHWHEDHIGSTQDVLTNFTVKRAYIRPNTTGVDTSIYKNTMNALKKVTCEYPKAGDNIKFRNIKINVIGPCSDKIEDKDENKNSMAFTLDYGKKRMFFGGDTPQENETEIIESGANLSDISIYKVSHHGSTYSSSYAFVRAMTERKSTKDPFYGIICVGKDNSYFHPHDATIKRLEQADGKIYRTDKNGNIIVTTDGSSIKIKTEKNSETKPVTKPTTTPSVSSKGKYIGNKNSKIFHIDTCSSLPAEKNRVYFSSYEKASAEGYRACKRCLG